MHTKWDMGMTNENTQQHEASHGLSAIAELLVFQAAKPIEKRREKTYKNTAVTRYIHIAEILGSQISIIYDIVSMQAILTQASRHYVSGEGDWGRLQISGLRLCHSAQQNQFYTLGIALSSYSSSFTCQLISVIITTLIIHHSITLSLQSRLKTYLFNKSFPS